MLSVQWESGKVKDKDTVVVYYSTGTGTGTSDFLYPLPKQLFSELIKIRSKKKNLSPFFQCPAMSESMKSTYFFDSPFNLTFPYDFRDGNKKETLVHGVKFISDRDDTLSVGPIVRLELQYYMFAEEPLEAIFTPPYFHKPKHQIHGSALPGQFDIGQWFRPYVTEFQMWNETGTFVLEKDEPLFYVRFNTDKKVILKRFEMTPKTYQYSKTVVSATDMFPLGSRLIERYKSFKNVGLREKILKEIKANIIDDI